LSGERVMCTETRFRVCSFDSGVKVTKRTTYEDFREQMLMVGRFSEWEASEHPTLYMRLMRDPIVEKVEMGFPWTGVKRRTT